MTGLRDRLTLAIEVVSLISAVGIVISAFAYSVVFGMLGINYLGIVTFGDVLRDSMQFLMKGLLLAAAFIPIALLADYYWVRQGRKEVPLTWKPYFFGLALSVVVGLVVQSIAAIGALVDAKEPIGGSNLSWWQSAMIYGSIFQINWLYNIIRREVNKLTLLVGLLTLTVCTFIATGFSIWETIKSDLPADVYPVDKELCGGKYVTLWLGESRMVARCVKGKHIVVKVFY